MRDYYNIEYSVEDSSEGISNMVCIGYDHSFCIYIRALLCVLMFKSLRSLGSADEFFTGDGSPAAVHRLLTGMFVCM